MPRQSPVAQPTQSAAVVNLVTTAETVVTTLLGISTDGLNQTVNIDASGEVTAGTGTTSIQVRIRRGTTAAGTQVGVTQNLTVAAGNKVGFALQVGDVPGEVVGQQYVLTIQQVAATGNGTVDQASIQAIVQ